MSMDQSFFNRLKERREKYGAHLAKPKQDYKLERLAARIYVDCMLPALFGLFWWRCENDMWLAPGSLVEVTK